jgi:hypothetical protein
MLTDFTFWIYALTVLVSLISLVVFILWWARIGKASTIYACFTFMLFSISCDKSMALYARYIKLTESVKDVVCFTDSLLWDIRGVFFLLSLLVITYVSVGRYIKTILANRKYKKLKSSFKVEGDK